jgi:hypothetical protein
MTETVTSPLGLIAGQGDLPRLIIEHCHAVERPLFVVAINGQTPTALTTDVPHARLELGQAGRIIQALRDAHVREIVMAGALRRPSLGELKPDLRGAKLLARGLLQARGDDALLRLVTKELEGEGFRVIGAHEIIGDLVAPEGVWTKLAPDETASADIARGMEVASALGALDIGQSVVVQQGLVLGVEAIEGTDALLARCASLHREGPGGVLVKRAKPGQEKRADLPTVGVGTVHAAREAGLRGIAVQSGATLAIGRAAMIETADRAGVFLCGVGASDER